MPPIVPQPAMAAAAVASAPFITAAMFEAALTIVMYAADKVPDHWFEKIPGGYYRPKDDKDKKKHKRSSRHHRSDRDHDDYYKGDDYDDGYASEGYEDPRERRGQRNDYDDTDSYSERSHRDRRNRGQSMGAPRGLDGGRYEAPLGGVYGQPRYNPADYAVADARSAHVASRQGDDRTRYVAPGFGAGAAAAYQQEPSRASSSSSSGPTASYVPYADVYGSGPGQQPRQTRLERDADFYPHARSYQPAYQSDNPYAADPYAAEPRGRYSSDDYYRKNGDSSRPRHKSRNRPRAKSSVRDQFDVPEKDGYGGAVAGGPGDNTHENRDRTKSKSRRSGRYDDTRDERYTDRYTRRDDDRYGGRDDYGRRGGSRRISRPDGYYSD